MHWKYFAVEHLMGLAGFREAFEHPYSQKLAPRRAEEPAVIGDNAGNK